MIGSYELFLQIFLHRTAIMDFSSLLISQNRWVKMFLAVQPFLYSSFLFSPADLVHLRNPTES